MRRLVSTLFPALLFSLTLTAQSPKDVRAAAKPGPSAIPTVAGYLNSVTVDTRAEAVKQLIAIGGKDIIDPLIRATRDADPEVQIRATDGLVNYYLPGYVKQGLGSSIVRAGVAVKAHFSDTNDQVVDAFVIVRPDVIEALGKLARGGSSLDSRANACRAVGILRGKAAEADLIDALRSKDNRVMYESLIALQKIRDPEAGPKVTYLVRDLDDKVQGAAIETVGLLRTKDALPALRNIIANPRNKNAERSALEALAFMPDPGDRALLNGYLSNKDDKMRAQAAEGLGRIANPADRPALVRTWTDEDKMLPRLGAAFALIMSGDIETGAESPFEYLVNTLNSASFKDVAEAYLIEAAAVRVEARNALYKPLEEGTRDEKIGLARVLSASGDAASIPYLDKVSRDADAQVAEAGLRCVRSLRARLGV
jgi:HEAT repeat protein